MTTQSLMGLVRDLIPRLAEGTLEAGFEQPLQRGSARGRVSVVSDPHEHGTLVMIVRMQIMPVPSGDRPRLYRTLLELNDRLEGRAAFAIDDTTVQLVAGRPLDDMDPGELVDLILWTAERADHYDDLLQREFPSS